MPVEVETVSAELDGGTGGVSVDGDGRVYVADFGAILSDRETMGRRIFRLRPGERAEVFATGFEGASGNEFDRRGNLYQSNIRGNFISRIAPDGTSTVFAREGIAAPVDIVFDDEGALYVANCGDGSIRRISADGRSSEYARSDLLRCPNGLAFDSAHNLYVANFDNGDVIEISSSGSIRRLATLPGGNNGHLTYHNGSLYVVARGDHRIHRVELDGRVAPYAGSGERGRRDGPAHEATFSYPNDIAVGPDGSFFVNEIASTTCDATRLSPMIVRRIREFAD